MVKLLKKHWIIFLILVVGLFLRSYKPLSLFMYSHDQDLAGWFIKDIVENKDLRLIGQETSSKGVFIGPLFYYLQIPFYVLAGMDPAGALLLPIVLSGFAIFSIYFVLSKVFSNKVGLIASVFYALSYLIIFTDREIVPTMPVMLWTIWFFYAVHGLLAGKQKMYVLLGILGGLIWNFNLALALLSPLIFAAQVLSEKKLNFRYLFLGIGAFTLLMLPFFVFEARNDFQQTNALVTSFTTPKDYVEGTTTGWLKVDRVIQIIHKNTTNLVWDSVFYIPVALTFYSLIILFAVLAVKKVLNWKLSLLMLLWQVLFVVFFSLNSLNPSEYYFNGMNIIWIVILSLSLSRLHSSKKFGALALVAILGFSAINLYGFFNRAPNDSGYVQKKAIVEFIKKDAQKHNYPCVSVSYITSPGNELGYRYFFWMNKMHVNQPKSGSPVYTIVFPHSKVSRIDQSFGALGLVLPDYERYNEKAVNESCSGQNSNLTDPMFGYIP